MVKLKGMKNGIEIFEKLHGVDAVLLENEKNTFYVSEYECTNAHILLTAKKSYYLTDTRYIEEATALLGSGFEVVTVTYFDVADKVRDILSGLGVNTLGFEDLTMTYSAFQSFQSDYSDYELIGIEGQLDAVREIKTPHEIELIAHSASINDIALSEVFSVIREGMTENDLRVELEYRMQKHGSVGLAFDTIAAFGVNTSKPHAHPGDMKLEKGMPITLDFGSLYKGYCSDMTRTFFFGEPTAELKKLYADVLKANELGIAAVKCGVAANAVDEACRGYFREINMEQYFIHGTGHGVGIHIHEAPTLNPRSTEHLKCGMLVTVEPGLYLAGVGGVRIEDLLVVEKDGYRKLSNSNKQLTII